MGLLTPVAVRIGAISWMPRLLPQITWVDKRLQSVSRGRVSLLTIAGLPNLMLTTRGRTSGIDRTTPLLCVPDQGSWLIAGSNFGGSAMPAWVFNLRANPSARIGFGGREIPILGTELSGDHRADAWAVMLRTWPNFALYEVRTKRSIPVFRLTPVQPAPN